jgi:hypothetical protein
MNIPLLGGGLPSLPDLGGIDTDDLKDGPRDQLLVCGDCHTIEHIPAFDGPMEHNQPLQARLRNHLVPMAEGVSTHAIAFTTVNARLWATSEEFRTYIAKAITDAEKTGDVGLGSKMYDLKSTFQEDAMNCWRHAHNRTQDCGDYKSEKMKLVPDTKAERKDLGLETRHRFIESTVFICDYCPYKSIVMQKKRRAEGYY